MTRPVHRAALAATLCVLVPGALVGTAASATAADPKPDTISASATVPGEGYDAQTVVMPRGTAAITYTSAGLTKYQVGPHRMVRLGTASVPMDESPDGEELLVHPAGGYVYLVWDGRVQIFDVTKRAPKLVRTLGNGATTAAFAPDGRRLFLGDATQVRVLGTKNAARPTKGVSLPVTAAVSALGVTPDGTQLVSGSSVEGDATVGVYTLGRVGAPVPARSGAVAVPGWDGSWPTLVDDIVMAPGATTQAAYLDVSTTGADATSPDHALLSVQLADLTTTSLPDQGDARTPYVEDVTANGNRVYFTYGVAPSRDEHRVRALAWADRALAASTDVDPVGDILATAVSKASSTRGLAYIVVLTKSGMQLRSVKVW